MFKEPYSAASQDSSEPCWPVTESVSAKEGMNLEATRNSNVLKQLGHRRSSSCDQAFSMQTPDSRSAAKNADIHVSTVIGRAGALPMPVQRRCKSASLQSRHHRHSLNLSVYRNLNTVLPEIPSNEVISTVPVHNFKTSSENLTTIGGPSRRWRSSSLSESPAPYTKVRPNSAHGRRRVSSSLDALKVEDGMVLPFEETSLQTKGEV